VKNNYKLLHVLALVAIYLCLGTNGVKAQAVFTMSSVGEFSGVSSVSSAVQFSSEASCIDIQSGIAVLEGERGTGSFAVNCEMPSSINTLGVSLYPNPANSFAKIKFVKTPPLTENFNVTVSRTDGVVMMVSKETGYSLFQGITLDVSRLTSGMYTVKIESPHYVDATQFIKAY
jgi:hypothetical protein